MLAERSTSRAARRALRLAPLVLLLLFTACRSSGSGEEDASGSPAPGQEDPAAVPDTSMPYRTIAEGAHCGFDTALFTVVSTPERWNALWSRLASTSVPAEPPPAVELESESVVVVCIGPRPTAGYAVRVTDVRAEAGALVVELREERPAPDALQAAVVTTPFQLVAVPPFEGPPEFRVSRD